MLKYVNHSIVFQEVPDEVTFAVNISNCPCNCIGCHSDFLKTDTGEILDEESLEKMISPYLPDITCVALMGGDAEPKEVQRLAQWLKGKYDSRLKTAWYSGRQSLPEYIEKKAFNYIKLGPYIEGFGPLKQKTTNQRMYKVDEHGEMIDITSRFWKE